MAAPAILRAQSAPLKVGTYGGYFEDSFNQHIFPDFTAATGIEVESIGTPTGEAWLVQLQQAARAGQAPADVSMMAQVARIRGERAGLWARWTPRGAQPREPARRISSTNTRTGASTAPAR
jgi:putative spermidine/putrescine transport system substrate-binding protein